MFQQRTARFATLLEYATLPVLLLQPLLGTQVSKTALALRRGERGLARRGQKLR